MESNDVPPEIQVLTDDLLSPDMPSAAGQFPVLPIQMNRSLENILLDASPLDESIDLESSETVQTLEPSLPSSSSIRVDQPEPPEENIPDKDSAVVDVDCGTSDQKVSFEDIISHDQSVADNQPVEKVAYDENVMGEHFPGKETVIESLGRVSIGETVPVGFVEEKGMRAAESTRSLINFFTESSGGTDIEGKGFFDSFTTGETADEKTLVSQLSFGSDVEKTSSSLPSSVPPSPHIIIPASAASIPCPAGSPAAKLPFFQVPSLSSNGAELEVEVRRHLSLEGVVPLVEGAASEQNLTDAFISGMNDDDRRYDAWIPSEMTRQTLISVLTSHPGSVLALPPTQLCMPGIVNEEALGDPVRDLVQRYMGDSEANKRLVLNADNVPQDDIGLCQLIKAGCLRSAIDLTSKLLKQWGQGPTALNQPTKHSPYSLQLWFCRLLLLAKLKLFSQVERELEPFGNLDSPDLYYEYYQDVFPMRRGSLVPFDMRILHAELPQYSGRVQDSLDRLCYMMAVVSKMLSNLDEGLAEDGSMLELSEASRKASKELWQMRDMQILYSLGSCLLNMKDFGSAIEIYKKLMLKDEKNHTELECAIGRIYLQMGDTEQASRYFHQVEVGSPATSDAVRFRNLINRGLVALGNNQFLEAYQLFKEVTDVDKTNVLAVNNMAVCALYLGRLKESLGILESLVHGDPARNLQDGILLNLSTLYELESSRALQKKQGLLSLVSEHRGDGFSVACLKMA